MKSLRFDVFGRQVLVMEFERGWATLYLGVEGKRRPATEIVMPQDIPESEIEQFLGTYAMNGQQNNTQMRNVWLRLN